MWLFELWVNYFFSYGTLFLLKITTEKQLMAIQISVFNRFSLKNAWSDLVTWRKSTVVVFAANDKMQDFKQKLICAKHESTPWAFQYSAFQYFKTFLMRFMVIFTNVIFWHFIMKCFNMWKICISQWTNIFWMTKAWCYKLLHKKKDPFQAQESQWILI